MGWYAHCLFGLGFGFDQEINFLRKRGLTPLFLSLVSKKEFEHEIGSDSQLITPIFGCFVAVRRVLAQCGRIYGVNGRFHLTMLNKASNINARLAFLAKPL